jgi:Mg-chelatase subunit ChlD
VGSLVLAEAANALGDDDARSVWNALTGRTDPRDGAGLAAWLTMPDNAVAALRRAGGLPAAAFSRFLGRHARNARPQSDAEWRAVAGKAWADYQRLAASVDEFEYGLGCDESDGWAQVLRLSVPKTTKMAEIAKLAGRMYSAMKGVRRRTENDSPEEVVGVTLGKDIPRLLAAEHAQLGSDIAALSVLASMRLMQRKSLQLRLAGETPADRGPLVVALDESGSMHDQRNVWAKACFVALARIAHEERRIVDVVHHSGHAYARRIPVGDYQGIVDASLQFQGGGTDLARALNVCAMQVKDLAANGWSGADVVFISDGEDGNASGQARAIDAMRKGGTKLWTVSIECDLASSEPLRAKAETYLHINERDFEDAGQVKGLGKAAMGNTIR